MKHFTIYNESGEILRSGQVPDEVFHLQCMEGEFIIEAQSDPGEHVVDVATQQVVAVVKPEPVVDMNYALGRVMAYPHVNEQMDMLWHAMDDGTLPKVEPFYSRILAVKLAYPKDNSVVPGSVVVYPEGSV